MKLIVAIIRPERLEAVQAALAERDVYLMTVTDVRVIKTIAHNRSGSACGAHSDQANVFAGALLVYNHAPRGRSPLNVAISKDGKSWQAALVLENEPGEYSYPAVIQTKDGMLHVTYTWKREKVRHAVIDPARLKEN